MSRRVAGGAGEGDLLLMIRRRGRHRGVRCGVAVDGRDGCGVEGEGGDRRRGGDDGEGYGWRGYYWRDEVPHATTFPCV